MPDPTPNQRLTVAKAAYRTADALAALTDRFSALLDALDRLDRNPTEPPEPTEPNRPQEPTDAHQ